MAFSGDSSCLLVGRISDNLAAFESFTGVGLDFFYLSMEITTGFDPNHVQQKSTIPTPSIPFIDIFASFHPLEFSDWTLDTYIATVA